MKDNDQKDATSSKSTSISKSKTSTAAIQPISKELLPSDLNPELIKLIIAPSTGGTFEIEVKSNISVSDLKYIVARKMQMPKEKLNLIHKDKTLKWGTILEYDIENYSKLVLIPNVETGFAQGLQNTEQSIVQAIEGLSDKQIDEFLSGRAPLTLALRVDDHMMFVQLQLEQTNNDNSKNNFNHLDKNKIQNNNPNSNKKSQNPAINSPVNNLNLNNLQISPQAQREIQLVDSNLFQKLNILKQQGTLSPEISQNLRRQRDIAIRNIYNKYYEANTNNTKNTINNNASSHQSSSSTSSNNNNSNNKQISQNTKTQQPTINPPKSGACINTFVRHGPGIFSGTFSGSLHPSIQDENGKPKRDPKTILQILNDLLSATQNYQQGPALLQSVSVNSNNSSSNSKNNKNNISNSNLNSNNSKKCSHKNAASADPSNNKNNNNNNNLQNRINENNKLELERQMKMHQMLTHQKKQQQQLLQKAAAQQHQLQQNHRILFQQMYFNHQMSQFSNLFPNNNTAGSTNVAAALHQQEMNNLQRKLQMSKDFQNIKFLNSPGQNSQTNASSSISNSNKNSAAGNAKNSSSTNFNTTSAKKENTKDKEKLSKPKITKIKPKKQVKISKKTTKPPIRFSKRIQEKMEKKKLEDEIKLKESQKAIEEQLKKDLLAEEKRKEEELERQKLLILRTQEEEKLKFEQNKFKLQQINSRKQIFNKQSGTNNLSSLTPSNLLSNPAAPSINPSLLSNNSLNQLKHQQKLEQARKDLMNKYELKYLKDLENLSHEEILWRQLQMNHEKNLIPENSNSSKSKDTSAFAYAKLQNDISANFKSGGKIFNNSTNLLNQNQALLHRYLQQQIQNNITNNHSNKSSNPTTKNDNNNNNNNLNASLPSYPSYLNPFNQNSNPYLNPYSNLYNSTPQFTKEYKKLIEDFEIYSKINHHRHNSNNSNSHPYYQSNSHIHHYPLYNQYLQHMLNMHLLNKQHQEQIQHQQQKLNNANNNNNQSTSTTSASPNNNPLGTPSTYPTHPLLTPQPNAYINAALMNQYANTSTSSLAYAQQLVNFSQLHQQKNLKNQLKNVGHNLYANKNAAGTATVSLASDMKSKSISNNSTNTNNMPFAAGSSQASHNFSHQHFLSQIANKRAQLNNNLQQQQQQQQRQNLFHQAQLAYLSNQHNAANLGHLNPNHPFNYLNHNAALAHSMALNHQAALNNPLLTAGMFNAAAAGGMLNSANLGNANGGLVPNPMMPSLTNPGINHLNNLGLCNLINNMKRPGPAASPHHQFNIMHPSSTKRRKKENTAELNAKHKARVMYLKNMFQIQKQKRLERNKRLEKIAAQEKQKKIDEEEQLKNAKQYNLNNKKNRKRNYDGKLVDQVKDSSVNNKFIPDSPSSVVDAYMNITSPHVCVPLTDTNSGDEITVPTSPAMPTAK